MKFSSSSEPNFSGSFFLSDSEYFFCRSGIESVICRMQDGPTKGQYSASLITFSISFGLVKHIEGALLCLLADSGRAALTGLALAFLGSSS